MNKVILMGRLARDPELRYTSTSQTAQCTFSIAVDRPGKSADGTTKADFINCVAWRQNAEFISKYFTKGSRMLLTGSIQVRDYTNNEGKKVYVTEVIVDNVEFCDSKNSSSGNGNQNYDAAPKTDKNSGSDAGGYFPLDQSDFAPF